MNIESKLGLAGLALVAGLGCGVPDSDPVVEHSQSISERNTVKGKGCPFNRPHKEDCDGLTDEEREASRKIIESTKQNLIEGLGGVQEGVHSGSFIDSDVFTPLALISSSDRDNPFAISCASEVDGVDFNNLILEVINDARTMIVPWMKKDGGNFTNEIVNLDIAGENLIACGRTEMSKDTEQECM